MMIFSDSRNTFQHYKQNTDDDDNKQHHIKIFACLGIGFKNYFVKILFKTFHRFDFFKVRRLKQK